eukprot:s3442_g6.t1
MPFIVARLAGADGKPDPDLPPRGYVVPHDVLGNGVQGCPPPENNYLSLFLTMDKAVVENALMATETKQSLIELANSQDITINKDKGKQHIAGQVATVLTKPFTEAEKRHSEAKKEKVIGTSPHSSSSTNSARDIYLQTFDKMSPDDLMLMTKWCLATLEDNAPVLLQVNMTIARQGSDALKAQITYLTYLQDKEMLNGLVLIIYDYVKGKVGKRREQDDKTMTADIYLHEEDETDLRTFQLVVDMALAKVVWTVHFGKKAEGRDLYKYLTETFHTLERSKISIKFGTSSGASTLMDYDNLATWFRNEPDAILYLHLSLAGGGVIRKSLQKKKSETYKEITIQTGNTLRGIDLINADVYETAKAKIASFTRLISDDPVKAVETMTHEMSVEDLEKAMEMIATTTQGAVDAKLKNLASVLLGNEVKKIFEMNQSLENIMTTAECSVQWAYHSMMDNGENMGKIRAILKSACDRQQGYNAGVSSTNADMDL